MFKPIPPDNKEDNDIWQMSKLAVYLSQVIDELEEHKSNLDSKYGSYALEDLCNYYQQLTEDFDNHLKYESDPFYRIIQRGQKSSRLAKQIGEASLAVAVQFEKYANGERKYSRATIRRLLSSVIISIRSLYDYCIQAGGVPLPTPPIHTPWRDTRRAEKMEVNMLDPTTLPVLLKTLDFLFGEGSKILQERREHRQTSQERDSPKDDKGASPPKGGEDMDKAIQSKESALKQKIAESAWRSSEAKVNHLLSQLETHTRNYYLAKEQYAKYGSALVPPIIVHNLAEAEDGMIIAMQDLRNILSNIYGKKVVISSIEKGE